MAGTAADRVPVASTGAPVGERSRVLELDLLRLIAALMVVAYHYTYRLHAQGGYSPVAYPAAVGAVTRYGYLGVELFFFISGAVILRSAARRSAGSFVAGRGARLFPAYWAAVTITFIARGLWGFGPIEAVRPMNYLGNLTMLQGFYGGDAVDSVYWTLTRELVFYAIVWATLLTGQLRRIKVVLGAWLCISIAMEFVTRVPWGRAWFASNYAPYFVAGACCALLASPEGRRQRRWTWTLLGVSVAMSLWFASGPEADRMDHTFAPTLVNRAVVAAVVGLSFLVVLAVSTGRFSRWGRPWMVTAGLLTYPVYLVHQNLGAILFTNFRDVNRWILLVGITALMCALAWVLHRVIERPLGPLLHRGLSRFMPEGDHIGLA